MANGTPKRIYYVDKRFSLWDTEPNGAFYSNRRPYNISSYFKTKRENLNFSFQELSDNSNHDANTNQNTNNDWHQVNSHDQLLKTGDNFGMDFFWKVKTAYQQVAGWGGGFGNASGNTEECYWHPGVTGATFTWTRENCHFNTGECALRRWGMNYWNPNTNKWRTVLYDIHQDNTASNIAKPYYRSTNGNEWRIHGGKNPADLTGGKDGKYACSSRASSASLAKLREDYWLWGGVWFQVNCTNEGSQSHTRSFRITDFQPTYSFDTFSYSSAQLIVPTNKHRTMSNIQKKTMYLAPER